MADNLIFPIGFDLEEAVKKAGQEWNSTYADKLEKLLAKRAITVNLGFSTKNLNNLDDVKRRLAELKIEPLTPENKTAIRDLVRELKELARIMEKIQKFKGIELPELQMAKAAKLRKDVAQADEKLRLSQERVRQSEERLILSQQRAAQQAKNTGKAFGEQERYLSNLIKKMAVYASFSYVGTFLTSVREVTAQFELQRVSLGAILQDANKGEQIFSQIKQFALKSPISILDLTKYTKQLAAYKIGYDELFDTTKRLADVSVGLGVDFQRIVLLYGQVRATGYLRASEVRQATEAGIPLVEELAAKLTKVNGELVTAADVMDMISKRAISFDMVKEVFTDMTSAGGAFYQMQEKQGNTLYGLWAKLGDAASVMYEQIGNTDIVNEGMKEAIQMLTELMRNWKAVGLTAATSILPAVAAMAAWKMATKALAKSVATATSERIAAEAKLATAMKGTDIAAQNAARSSLAKAKADEAAAIAAQKNATAQSRLKMGFVSLGKTIASGLGIGIAVMLVTNLIYKFYEALTNFRKLKRELDSIYTETATLQDQSVRNFEFLADKAVHAAAGSKEQTDALQELNRTYRDILPQEALTIENLTKMKGKYDALTQSIREYVAEQQKQKAESAIMEYYGTKIRDAQMDVRERLYDQDLSATEVGRFFAEFEKIAPKYGNNVWGAFRDAMITAGVKDSKRIAEIWKKEFEFKQRDIVSNDTGNANIRALTEAYADQANELKGMNEQYRESIGNLGKFSDMQKRVSDAVANATYKTTGGEPIDPDKQGDLLDAMKLNVWVKQTASEIQNNEDIKKAFAYMGEGIKSEWFSIINVLNSNDLGKVSQINFDAIIASVDSLIAKLGNKNPKILAILNTFRNYLVAQKKEYENMVPSDLVVNRWRSAWRTIASEVGISRQYMNRFLMQSGDDFEAYRKKIKEELTATINNLRVLQEAIAKTGVGKKMIPGMWRPGTDQFKNNEEYYKAQEAEKKAEALKKLLDELDKIELETGKKKKGSKSDTRLQVLQEVAQTLATINKEYDDLAKKEGASKALADIKERFKEVLAYTNKIGGKFGLKFDFPTEFKTLQEYRNAILKVMQSLKGLPKGSEKTILDFKTMIGKADSDYLQKQIEKQLKELADKISRTKTAKEFYDKILAQTGDKTLALQITYSIYPESGKDLYTEMQDLIRRVFDTGDALKNEKLKLRLGSVFDDKNERINYRELDKIYAEFQNDIKDKNRETAQKLIAEGQKTTAAQILNWEKELAKAKSYEEQRTDIINKAAEERAKIIKEVRDPKEQEKLLGLSREKESQDLAKVNFEEFTKSEDYVRIFENLDNVATSSLKHLREELQKVIDTNQNLSPENMKTLVKAMEDIDEQIGERTPFETLVSSAREYVDSIKNIKQAKQELADAEAEYKTQEPQLTADIETAKAEKETADTDVVEAERELLEIQNQRALLEAQGTTNALSLVELKEREITAENNLTSAKLRQSQAETNITKAEQAQVNAQEKIANAQKKVDKSTNDAKKAQTGFTKSLEKGSQKAADVQSLLQGFKDLLGDAAAEGTVIGGALEGGIKAMQQMQTIYGIIIALQTVYNAVTESNPWMAIAAAVLAVAGILTGAISAAKVAEANREIEKQEKLLDQLEYAYGRLEKAAEKVFGADYINNFNQRQKTLQAQAIAYQKQYQAELSKGKKADEEKLKEYKEKYRDTMDEIADMQGQVAERMLGTDLTSAARDFAQAWLDAYKQFGNTADAMSEKFHEMIENMVVESLMAKAMQRALEPTFKMIDKMDEEDFYDENFWRKVMESADKGSKDANAAGAVIMEWAKKWGYDGREKAEGFTGIAKNIAGATSEEINTAAAIGNTLMYYVSPIPRIDENLARVVALMEGRGASAIPQTASTGWTDWQQQAMDNYQAIARNTAETVVRCERAAIACEKMARVIKTKGATSGFNVFLNS